MNKKEKKREIKNKKKRKEKRNLQFLTACHVNYEFVFN